MTSLNIKLEDITSLVGKKVLLTGSSGIGLAAAKIFAQRGADVLILDLNSPLEALPSAIEYRKCDISQWAELKSAFLQAGNIDIAVANAGVSEDRDYFADTFDEEGELLEPAYPVMEVNLKAVFNFVKLSLSHFRKRKSQGSIVITSSATAYSPEQSLPVYSACKLALIGLVRSLRSTVIHDNITINAIAPAATITSLLPAHLAAPIIAAGLPVSTAEHVGLAVVYSSSATQLGQVELYGRDPEELANTQGRWNGRTILTLGDRYTELEEPIARLRGDWFGEENKSDTRKQQMATDFRPFPV
ncbi:short chain dehydrogenase reductase family [Penicillium soppii]|uniref:short chain dehydrogenase reductase family n=1 Tax=Penicillium soppii TaxID=69789 RepID=UPI00254823FA|nr:short chain dehydrogenase reductase family [Penicillium soppii]KAJ5874095.1 short chain dehydrogenase reductase family [Penicillium soppii]